MNALPESQDVKDMILKASPENTAFLEAASFEYKQLVKKLERDIPKSILDLSLD